MKILNDDRGNSMVSAMVGTVVGMMLMAMIAGGLSVFMNFYLNIGSTNAITEQKAHVDQQLRKDVAWASNIASETITDSGFTIITPSTDDSTCVEAVWEFKAANGKNQLIRTAKTFEETIIPQNNAYATAGSISGASSCGGEMIHQHSETMLNDSGSDAKFTFSNAAGLVLVKNGTAWTVTASSGADVATQSAKDSLRVAGVILDAKAAASGSKASPVKIVQYARNLETKNVTMKTRRIETMNLGG